MDAAVDVGGETAAVETADVRLRLTLVGPNPGTYPGWIAGETAVLALPDGDRPALLAALPADGLPARVARIVELGPRPRRERPELVVVDEKRLERHLAGRRALTASEVRAELDPSHRGARRPRGGDRIRARRATPPLAARSLDRRKPRASAVSRRPGRRGERLLAAAAGSRTGLDVAGHELGGIDLAAARWRRSNASRGEAGGPVVPTTRFRTLFLAVPIVLAMGVWAIGTEVADHGLPTAVVAGLFAGGFLGAAMLVFAHHYWNRPRSRAELRRTRLAWERTRPAAVGGGLLVAGLATAIGGLAGGAGDAAGILAMSAFGVVFIVAAAVVSAMAIAQPEWWR